MKSLRLYSRQECHLCEDLAAALAQVIRGRARLEIVDIDEDLDLKKRYGQRIPVLVGDGLELSSYPLNAAAVEAYLAATDD